MTFRLITVLYLFALLAASLAVFGAWGVVFAALVFVSWSAWMSKPKPTTIGEGCVMAMVVLVLLVLLVPAVQYPHEPSRSDLSLNNLKWIELALLNYHDANKHFPPPYVTDDEGNKLYSWRVLILPYVEGDTIHKRFHYDEPWDSPHNKQFLTEMDLFSSPRVSNSEDAPGMTNYVAVVGPETMWQPDKKVSLRDITDGTSKTINLLEIARNDVYWSEPVDVTTDQAVRLLTGRLDGFEFVREGYFVSERVRLSWRCAAYVDGHCEVMRAFALENQARARLTIADGEPEADEYLETTTDSGVEHVETIIHWDRVWGVAVWLALVLLPAVPAARRKIWPSEDPDEEQQQELEETLEH